MVRRCSDKLAKLLLVVFNGLFFICGIILLALGAQDFEQISSVNSIQDNLNSSNGTMIAVGVIICVISFLGCYGSYKENTCMLNSFLAFLVILLIAEIVVGYLAFDNRAKIDSAFDEGATKSLATTARNKIVAEAWDDVQVTMHCCGCKSFNDYYAFNLTIPNSCCKKLQPGGCHPDMDGFSSDGCCPKMKSLVRKNTLIIGGAAIIIAFVEVAGIIFASCLRSAINKRYETV